MLIAISVSTNYSDILEIILKQNIKSFDHWYIITQKNDKNTINLIKNIDKITILYYNFQSNNSNFDKGGALRYAQLEIHEKYDKSIILILDSDIYLPYNFSEIINNEIFQTNTLYGSLVRLDFYKLSDFYNKENFGIYTISECFCGYFQMYYIDKSSENCKLYLYDISKHCGLCDDLFKRHFTKFKILELVMYHFGLANTHWNGRINNTDFLIDKY